MSLFDFIFKKPQLLREFGTFQTLTGYTPVFTNWNGALYESEMVRSAVEARATHCGKLKIEINGKPEIVNALKHQPNAWQTWEQFLRRLSTILDMQNTAFIVPIIDKFGVVSGISTFLPSDYMLVQSKEGVPFMRFRFPTGQYAAMELSKVGIMTKFQYKSDYFGESNNALTPTMELINIQNQGIKEGVKSAATYRFMAQLSNFSNDDDLVKERENFSKSNLQQGGGVLLFPNSYTNIKQVDSKPYVVDAGQMRIINENVYNYFGVNEDILQNKAFGDAWSAFYEGAVESFAIQLSEVLSKMLFTTRERSSGSYVMATSNRLQYMSNKEKLEFVTQMGDRGMLMIDEGREVFNLPPLADGKGQTFMIRGEYYDVDEKIKGEESGVTTSNEEDSQNEKSKS